MSKTVANILFVIATIGWGSSYLFTKFAVNELEPFTLLAIRFAIAFFIAFFVFYKKLIKVSFSTLKASAILGILICLMYTMLCYVLKMVNPSTAGFLLATTVIFVPLITMCISKKLPQRQIIIGAIVTFIGLFIFMFNGQMGIDLGAILSIVTAIAFAFHLVINNLFTKKHDALQLGVYQLGFTCIFSFVLMLLFEPLHVPQSKLGWISIFILAIVCSAFGFVVQSVAQKYTSAEETGFILALEPIFAALFAYIVLGEMLSGREWIGAFVIFIGVLVASYQPKISKSIDSLSKTQ